VTFPQVLVRLSPAHINPGSRTNLAGTTYLKSLFHLIQKVNSYVLNFCGIRFEGIQIISKRLASDLVVCETNKALEGALKGELVDL
jgi:hypothetical protein